MSTRVLLLSKLSALKLIPVGVRMLKGVDKERDLVYYRYWSLHCFESLDGLMEVIDRLLSTLVIRIVKGS